MYIHELANWPHFSWQDDKLSELLASVRHKQGRLIGRMEALGFDLRRQAVLKVLTQEVVKSNEIEGEILDADQVRSSLARRMGIKIAGLKPADRDVEGVVEMMLDATQRFQDPLSEDRLFRWHSLLFPTGQSGWSKINVGNWRDDKSGPMQVVSGAIGREKVHYQAPDAKRLRKEMNAFLKWFETDQGVDLVLKAGVAHLWFVTIHPLDDGNGRIARAIADMMLARSENIAERFYSMSAQIRLERNTYYEMLERTQKGKMEITPWLEWFLACLDRAIDGAHTTLGTVLSKAKFFESAQSVNLNDRQKLVLNKLLDGFEGKLTSSKWAKLAKCSQDTANRDINDLVRQSILVKDAAGGRSTSYSLAEDTPIESKIMQNREQS